MQRIPAPDSGAFCRPAYHGPEGLILPAAVPPNPEVWRVRSNSTWFFVKAGHDIPEIERVVSRSDGYAVVEKLVAIEFAEEADPRTDGSN